MIHESLVEIWHPLSVEVFIMSKLHSAAYNHVDYGTILAI